MINPAPWVRQPAYDTLPRIGHCRRFTVRSSTCRRCRDQLSAPLSSLDAKRGEPPASVAAEGAHNCRGTSPECHSAAGSAKCRPAHASVPPPYIQHRCKRNAGKGSTFGQGCRNRACNHEQKGVERPTLCCLARRLQSAKSLAQPGKSVGLVVIGTPKRPA
jgi:hypothetical protein